MKYMEKNNNGNKNTVNNVESSNSIKYLKSKILLSCVGVIFLSGLYSEHNKMIDKQVVMEEKISELTDFTNSLKEKEKVNSRIEYLRNQLGFKTIETEEETRRKLIIDLYLKIDEINENEERYLKDKIKYGEEKEDIYIHTGFGSTIFLGSMNKYDFLDNINEINLNVEDFVNKYKKVEKLNKLLNKQNETEKIKCYAFDKLKNETVIELSTILGWGSSCVDLNKKRK